MKDLKNLKEELNVIELEERLEMVNVSSVDEVSDGGNGVCCCSDPA
ncbi:hypothetical protein [uncultured Tenacibaculum sp.]|nr:hypothetical protein [uncultured Tenacibaculum sp.]